jgi:hypothetical protein
MLLAPGFFSSAVQFNPLSAKNNVLSASLSANSSPLPPYFAREIAVST